MLSYERLLDGSVIAYVGLNDSDELAETSGTIDGSAGDGLQVGLSITDALDDSDEIELAGVSARLPD
jgi:hypothetical protein